ncbi:MAG: two-component regulator propeller domain-containing protein, partial [Prevotellaceae bacterium]|nr:two-component regulator propeller domain-containing protein [Prevotellaceae bacterium]
MRQFLLSFFLIFTQLAYPADYIYRHLTSDNGLPHHQVQSLIQDKDGNIWIGTRNGLARYDGYDIKCYYHNDKDSTSLNHNFIHNLFLDSKGQIWIVSNGGICRYQPETDNFHRYKYMSITSMAETSKGKLVCGGYNFWAYDE